MVENKERRPFIMKRPNNIRNAGPLVQYLPCIYPNANLSNLHKSARALRAWIESDELAIAHLKRFVAAKWPERAIRETIGVQACAARHKQSDIVLELQHTLEVLGFETYESITMVLKSHGIYLAGGPEPLMRKMRVIFQDAQTTERMRKFLLRMQDASMLTWPEDRLLQEIGSIVEEDPKIIPSRYVYRLVERFRSESRTQTLERIRAKASEAAAE